MSDSKTEDSRPDSTQSDLPPSELFAHLKAGYDNSQAVVRFLDTKASAVVGAVPIVVGALAALMNVVKDWGMVSAAMESPYSWVMWLIIGVTLHAFATLLALWTYPRMVGAAAPARPEGVCDGEALLFSAV
jgi:hypothetical protein